jgi:hypothetical protein
LSYNTNWPEVTLDMILELLPKETEISKRDASEYLRYDEIVNLRWHDGDVYYSVDVQSWGDGVRLDYDYHPYTGNGQVYLENVLDEKGHFSWAD